MRYANLLPICSRIHKRFAQIFVLCEFWQLATCHMASDQSKSVKLYSFAIGLCDKFDRGLGDSGTHSASFCCFIRAEVEVGCCAAPSSIKTQIWQIIVIGPADSRLIRVIRSAPGLLRKLGRPWNLRNHHMEFWLVVYTFAYFF